jgi:hypothetical protein
MSLLINYNSYVCNKYTVAEYSFILFISYIVGNQFATLNQQKAQYVVHFVGRMFVVTEHSFVVP